MDQERQLMERIKREVLFGRDVAPPVVDEEKCTGCGSCVTVCPGGIFELREERSHAARGWRCIACGHCTSVCPEG